MTDGAGREQVERGWQDDRLNHDIAGDVRTSSPASESDAERARVARVQELLRESETRFGGFAEASSDVLWVRDADTLEWDYISPAIEAVYGIPRDEASRCNDLLHWADLIVSEDREHALNCIARAKDGERVSFEYRIKSRQDGQIRWLRSNVFPIRNQDGRVHRIGGIGRDITALKSALSHQQALLAELQHRVRNTLAVVRSIVRRTADTSATVEDFANHLEGRIGAFSRVQVAVTRDPLVGFDLAELIFEELRACAAREGEQFTLTGPPARLKAKAAQNIALAIHELATNAVEHGALTVARGQIEVRWRKEQRESEVWLVLDWKESGMTGRPVEPRREGFGSVLLRHTLGYDLGAEVTLSYEPSGFRCEIAFPLGEGS